jgi:hypothetical protein
MVREFDADGKRTKGFRNSTKISIQKEMEKLIFQSF